MGLFAVSDEEFYKNHKIKVRGKQAFDGRCRKCGKPAEDYLFLCKECLKNARFVKRINLPTRRAKNEVQRPIPRREKQE